MNSKLLTSNFGALTLAMLGMMYADAAPTTTVPARKAITAPPDISKWQVDEPIFIERSSSTGDQATASIRMIDGEVGKYSLEWQDREGQKLAIEYYRPDTVNAIVAAKVGPGKRRKYKYSYAIQNTTDSGQYLSGLIVQSFVDDVAPIVIGNAHVGTMGSHIEQFSDGAWWRFGNDSFGEGVSPGSAATQQLESDFPPALVKCKIHGGPMRMVGVGEEMPYELESLLPAYEAWPSGFTIGPSDDPSLLSFDGRSSYLLEILDATVDLGWTSSDVFNKYERLLADANEANIKSEVLKDIANGLITSEIAAILGFQIGL